MERKQGEEAKRGGVRRSTKRMKCFIDLPLCASHCVHALLITTTTRLPPRACCIYASNTCFFHTPLFPPFPQPAALQGDVEIEMGPALMRLGLCTPSLRRALLCPLCPRTHFLNVFPSSPLPSLLPLPPKTTVPAPQRLWPLLTTRPRPPLPSTTPTG